MKRSAEFDLPLSLLREEIAASDLLPKADARSRPPLADALHFSAFLKHCVSDWPARLQAPFDSKSITTHASCADPFSLLRAGPGTFVRWCNETGLDLLKATQPKLHRWSGACS